MCAEGFLWAHPSADAEDSQRPERAELLHQVAGPSDLRDCLANAITAVTASHANTCDITHNGTPSATAAIVREHADAWGYLVLSDTIIVLDCSSGVRVVTDDSVAVAELAASRAHQAGTPDHDERLHDLITAQRRLRNTPEGYWLAGAQPDAASHALVGQVPLDDLHRAAVLTDRAARLAEPFHITDWNGLLDILSDSGPRQLLRQLRQAEASDPHGQRWPRHKPRDDATVAYLTSHRPRPR
jgi:hypothetical protein